MAFAPEPDLSGLPYIIPFEAYHLRVHAVEHFLGKHYRGSKT
jgi:hypothetical protein